MKNTPTAPGLLIRRQGPHTFLSNSSPPPRIPSPAMRPLLALLILSSGLVPHLAAAAERPNIIVILVDDMGFSDLGCYGSEIKTPNLDQLATDGIRFSQFYNTGRCCPTRAALLTGLYSHQAGVGAMTADWHQPGYRGFINPDTPTIAELLKPAGYFTICTGKWHVGAADGQRPIQRGFDRFFGIPEGGGFYFKVKKGRTIRRNDEIVYSVDKQTPDGFYTTHAFVEEGIAFIDEAIAAKQPFFWYLAHNAPHFPLQAPPETINRYRGHYSQGYAELRKERHRRQLDSSLFAQDWPLSPRDKVVPAWRALKPAQQIQQDELMAVYAACVEEMDRSIGTVVAALKRRGVLNNTLILFMSDNGGCAEGGKLGKHNGSPPGSVHSNLFNGKGWANAQDTPFRYYKHYVHEGGISTPLIAYWPSQLNDPGRTTHATGHVIDIMATCLDAAGADYPKSAPIPLEGRSLLPILIKMANPTPRTLFWEHEGNRAVRQGHWKLVALHKQAWELYDLSRDRCELNNLASQQPKRVQSLTVTWNAWAKRAQVLRK